MGNKDNTKGQELKDGVHAAFYNSDGSRISISTTGGRLILTDGDLKILRSIHHDSAEANSSFFSLDDKHIITGGQDKKLSVWNARTLEPEKQYDFNFNSWTSVHGYYTLGGCGEKGQVIFYNQRNGDTSKFILEKAGAFHVYYIKPDTSFVVSSGVSGYEINLQEKKIKHRYSGHKDITYCIMPDHGARRIVTASRDSTVKIFDRFTETCLYTSPKLDGAVYVSCFTNNDGLVAASTAKGSIYFMDTCLKKVSLKIKAFDTHINTIHCSPSGDKIVAGSEGGGAKIFSLKDGHLLHELDLSSLKK